MRLRAMKKQSQNKANFKKAGMNVSYYLKKDCENEPHRRWPGRRPVLIVWRANTATNTWVIVYTIMNAMNTTVTTVLTAGASIYVALKRSAVMPTVKLESAVMTMTATLTSVKNA